MIPVEQTKLGRPWGNCWEACIASILEIPVEEVYDNRAGGDPHPHQDWESVREWMLEHHSRLLVWFSGPFCRYSLPTEPYILSVYTSPELGPALPHAVVAQGAEIIHNPHPGRSDWGWRGIAGAYGLEILVPVDVAPARVVWLKDEEIRAMDPEVEGRED